MAGLGLELAEGLADLGEGVGEGLVPVHVRAAGAEFPGALLTQGCRHDRADQLSSPRRLADVGFGGAVDDRGGIWPGGGQRGRDDVEGEAHPLAVAAPLKAVDGTVAELEGSGLVAGEKRDPGRPDKVGAALVAERGAELAAFAQAG